jgi:hypothetical protein
MFSAFCQRYLPTLLIAGLLAQFVTQAHGIDFRRVELADGFDFPVGKPNAVGYYKARGFTPNGHLGEDWNGVGGGDSDRGDPIYAVAHGIVIVADDFRAGWGNCIIVRHAYRDHSGRIAMVDSQYAHLETRISKVGDTVKRGQLIGTMGGNRGMYPVHLHFEMRKNLQIGMNRTQFARDYSNYYSPTAFINQHRTLRVDLSKVEVPINNFAPYGKTLASVDPKPYLRRGYSIPVYRAPSQGGASSGRSADSVVVSSVIAPRVTESSGSRSPARTQTPPAAEPPKQETGGFWSRLKARFKKKDPQSTSDAVPQKR